LVLSWNREDLDTVLAFTKMRAEPMVFYVPVFVASGKTGRVSCCNVQSGLVVFKSMAYERDAIAIREESLLGLSLETWLVPMESVK
jgi:hypothetical protein